MISRTLATNTAIPPSPAALIHHPSDESSNTCLKNIIMSCICSMVTNADIGGGEGLTPPPASFLLADILNHAHDDAIVANSFRVDLVINDMPAGQILCTILEHHNKALHFILEKFRCEVSIGEQCESFLSESAIEMNEGQYYKV